MPERVLCVYDIKDNERCVAQFDTVREASQHYKKTTDHIHCIISRKTVYQAKYMFQWVNIKGV